MQTTLKTQPKIENIMLIIKHHNTFPSADVFTIKLKIWVYNYNHLKIQLIL